VKGLINISAFLFLTCIVTCQGKSQIYNDLNDYGYKGKIKSISVKFYSNITQQMDKWNIKDTLNPRTTIISYFNEEGNFTKKIVTSETNSYQILFDYSGKTKKGWRKIDNNGFIIEIGKITYNGNSGFTENVFDTVGNKLFQSTYLFNKNQKTKTLEDKGYNAAGGLNYNSFTNFEDDNEGHLYKLTTQDRLKNMIDNFEFVILEKDKNNNPVKLLLKKNEKPVEIRKTSIVYE
jgi:hypothetical protein